MSPENNLEREREKKRRWKRKHPEKAKRAVDRWKEDKGLEWMRAYNRQKQREARARKKSKSEAI